MITARLPDNEVQRVEEIQRLNVLSREPDLRIDCITQFIANTMGLDNVSASIIGSERILKSTFGLKIPFVPRSKMICSHALYDVTQELPTDRLYIIPDLISDDRFYDSPLVSNAPNARAYIGFVLQSQTGMNIGTFFALNTSARDFSEEDKATFIAAGLMVENIMLDRHYFNGIESILVNKNLYQ